MASRFWTGGANDGDWGNTNNWASSEGGAGGAGVPDNTDDVYVQATSQAITANLTTGKAFASVTINFAGSLGVAGTPFTCTCTGTITIRTLSGTHYIAATAAGTIVTVSIERTGTGKVYLSGTGAFTNVRCGENTQVDIASNTAVTTLETAGGACDVAYNATAITTLNQGAGSISSYRGITTANINGTLTTRGALAAITTANIFAGKHINWSAATITNSNVYPKGEATAKGSPYNCTVTNRKTFEGGKNYTDTTNVTFTNTATPIGGTT